MCGRYTSITPVEELAGYFGVEEVVADDLGPRYNVAPTDAIYAVARRGDGLRLGALRWGLVPPWADDVRVGARLINARAESVADKPAFRQAFARRRCLLPADGFYEWQRAEAASSGQPWYVRRGDGQPLALAGLWETWRPQGRDEDRVVSATIVTTVANRSLAPIHHRMPVVLAADAWPFWLDPANHDIDALLRLLVPAPEDMLSPVAVKPLVNRVTHDGPALVEAITRQEATQG
ncbi:MAG: SOS response-associated peptidase [Actinomycetota bacterium]|nr:SOS response-associated peptidase [Actinomycetota bacterium]